jgi:hypothetical protein
MASQNEEMAPGTLHPASGIVSTKRQSNEFVNE